LHRFACFFGDHGRWNAGVDDCGVVFGDVIVNDSCLVVNNRYPVIRHPVAVQPAMAQMRIIAVGEPAVAKPKTEAEPDVCTSP
jgi:transcriptional regulator of NAD metabolism